MHNNAFEKKNIVTQHWIKDGGDWSIFLCYVCDVVNQNRNKLIIIFTNQHIRQCLLDKAKRASAFFLITPNNKQGVYSYIVWPQTN